ncbi:MAG TPA: pitrilysin family protein [Dongiaceae bacterium]|nr:pitrilysin family protein [Dongiaceae bacterium]
MTPRAAGRFAALLVAVAAVAPAAAQDLRFPVRSETLPNGLRILVIEDHAVPAVTTFTLFRVGSRDERTGRTGISHLFEHLMFNGAAKYGRGEFDRVLESRGGTSNAFTAEDLTGYYDTFPSDALELVFDLEADRMAGLRIDEASLASEREVVKEERRLRIDNDVQGGMLELLNALVYMAHPYRWPIVGFMDDLDAITVEDCRDYFRLHYAPNNATLIVAGDVEPARVFALARSAYGSIPTQPTPPRRSTPEPEQAGERRAVLHRPAQLPQIMVAWPVPGTAAGSADVPVLDLIETVLGGGESSRLQRALVRERDLATYAAATNVYRLDASIFLVVAEARPGVAAADLEAALTAEIDRLVRDGVAEPELQKARNVRTMALLRSLKTSAGKANQAAAYEAYFGSHARLFEAPAALAAVTPARLREVAARIFRADRRSVVTLAPIAEAESPGEGTPAP